jgi:hypothetical protein
MLNVIAVGAAVLSLLAPSGTDPGAMLATAPPDRPAITKVNVHGPGCHKKGTEVAVSPDGEAFTATFGEYIAQVGPGLKPNGASTKCMIDITVKTPERVTYAVSQVDYRGYVDLAKGASAYLTESHHFNGPKNASTTHSLAGPQEGDFQFTDVVPVGERDFAKCGKQPKMNIDSSIGVKAGSSDPSATSWINMDSVDGSVQFKTDFHLVFKPC